jgi:hypothetical protein
MGLLVPPKNKEEFAMCFGLGVGLGHPWASPQSFMEEDQGTVEHVVSNRLPYPLPTFRQIRTFQTDRKNWAGGRGWGEKTGN